MGTTRYKERGRTCSDVIFCSGDNCYICTQALNKSIWSLEVRSDVGHSKDTYLPFSVTIVRREVSVIAL